MWKMWKWKASRLTALPPPVMSSWAQKRTPLTRASACQLETASALGCLKWAFVEKVGAPSHSPPPPVTNEPDPVTHHHRLPYANSRQAPWHSFPLFPPPKNVLSPSYLIPWPSGSHSHCLSMANFTQHTVQWLTVLTVCAGYWCVLWWSLSRVW